MQRQLAGQGDTCQALLDEWLQLREIECLLEQGLSVEVMVAVLGYNDAAHLPACLQTLVWHDTPCLF